VIIIPEASVNMHGLKAVSMIRIAKRGEAWKKYIQEESFDQPNATSPEMMPEASDAYSTTNTEQDCNN